MAMSPWARIGCAALAVPVLAAAAVFGYLWLNVSQARNAATDAQRSVRVGGTLADAVLASSAPVGSHPLLGCYNAECIDHPPGFVVSRHGEGTYSVATPDPAHLSFATAGDLRRALDAEPFRCSRLRVT